VPAGAVFGVPLGISFFGTAFSEPKLIKLASGYEAFTHSRAHNLPTFAATVPFDHVKGPLQQDSGDETQSGASHAVQGATAVAGAAAVAGGAPAAAPNQAATAKAKTVPHHL
jgi:hypothetical protein